MGKNAGLRNESLRATGEWIEFQEIFIPLTTVKTRTNAKRQKPKIPAKTPLIRPAFNSPDKRLFRNEGQITTVPSVADVNGRKNEVLPTGK
jgi:hypothetical protein